MAGGTVNAGSPPPSDRALELVRGAYDLHVHLGPDAVERSAYDYETAQRFAEVGMAGMVLSPITCRRRSGRR